ncbi:putative response regulatory protein [Blautia producta]|uniref:Stage 0 sporulation protein A homolog n=1 Tax=Blautia producta TaxID=33035 RepID=A0A4P6M275_9FIRM|nr:response regulator [Blautia producta]QBE97760.1 putative response regulatory protein [Blautia producta]
MYRIVIADDNEFSRKALVTLIPWEEIGCVICGEADNGNTACELISREKPDIALLDIRMPGLTGLEVVEKLNDMRQDCIYIMITAYDDFSYVQKGLKLGVFDYVLKPVVDSELRKILDKAIEKIKKTKEKNREVETLKSQSDDYFAKLKESSRELKGKLLGDGINGYMHSAGRLQEILGQEGRFRDFSLMLLSMDMENGKDVRPVDAFILEEQRILERCERFFPVRTVFSWEKDGFAVLVVYDKVMLAKDYNIVSVKMANEIWRENEAAGFHICISISNCSKNIEELPDLFEETIFARDSRFFLENKTVVHYKSLKSKSVSNEYECMKKLEELYQACRQTPGQIMEYLNEFLEQFQTDEIFEIEYIKNILIQAAIMMTHFYSQSLKNFSSVISVEDIIRELSGMPSIHEAFDWMRNFAQRLQEECNSRDNKSAQTRRILDYLNRNYSTHISLQDVADYMGISGAHVCRILKNDTGETFVSLLNKIRIMAAIRLLKSGEMKVYEIAEAVGFSNYAYFYQLFKKETGSSPKDYH